MEYSLYTSALVLVEAKVGGTVASRKVLLSLGLAADTFIRTPWPCRNKEKKNNKHTKRRDTMMNVPENYAFLWTKMELEKQCPQH